jgi:hypothetical protein
VNCGFNVSVLWMLYDVVMDSNFMLWTICELWI